MASVILFDGVCNLCNGLVQYIIKRDKKQRFMFAPIQSTFANEGEASFAINLTKINTVVLIDNGKVYTASTAVLRIARDLGFPYSLLICTYVIPKFIRDCIYSIVANNRYRWFGKRNACMVPTPEQKSHFLY